MVGNSFSPITVLINSMLARCKLWNILLDNVTKFCRPKPDFLTGIALKVTTMSWRDFDFPNKRYGNPLRRRSIYTSANTYPVFFYALQRDPLQLDCMDHRVVTLLGVFNRLFYARANVILPLWRTILQPVTFGLSIPNKSFKIMLISTNLKPVKQSKKISSLILSGCTIRIISRVQGSTRDIGIR